MSRGDLQEMENLKLLNAKPRPVILCSSSPEAVDGQSGSYEDLVAYPQDYSSGQ